MPRKVDNDMTSNDSVKSENVTANRMATEASEHVTDTVQEVVDEVGETHAGKDPAEVVEAVQEKWSAKVGDAAPALPDHKATEYAHHISEGNNVKVVPGGTQG
jgi:hypothetical protein